MGLSNHGGRPTAYSHTGTGTQTRNPLIPKEYLRKQHLAIVECRGLSRVHIFELDDATYGACVEKICHSIPEVVVLLKDVNGEELDGDGRILFFGETYTNHFWGTPVLTYEITNGRWEGFCYTLHYYLWTNFKKLSPKSESRNLIQQGEWNPVILPYLPAGEASVISSFSYEYVFELSNEDLRSLKRVEVTIHSTNKEN